MKNMKRIFYKILLTLGIIIISGTAITVLFLTWKMPLNNLHLKVFEYNFRRSVDSLHPKQSTLIAEAAEVGNWADGTYCEYFAGQFRLSKLPKETIRQFYFKESMSSGVDFIDEDIFNHSPWSEWKEKYLKNYKPKENENIYLVWKADYDNSPDGDIRCD
jgi:hypothetical protein